MRNTVEAPCWIPGYLDHTPAVAMPDARVPHWSDEQAARERISHIDPAAPVTPHQLDHPCVIVTCGGCGDTFDGESTAHFETVDEAHTAIGEGADWNRWTILAGGGYLCPACNPGEADR